MTSELEVVSHIKELVEKDLPNLPPHIKAWAEEHLVQPRQVTLALKDDGQGEVMLWLVTDHSGKRDSACRVVFDEKRSRFGLEMRMANGVNWFMGLYGSFAEAVDAM